MNADEFPDEISLMETRLSSSKAQTTANSENGPFIGPGVSWEEMMMQLQSFGKWIKEEVRQLEVNDLVWIVDDNVKRAHYKMGKELEVYHGSDGRVRSALVKTEDRWKTEKTSKETGTHVLRKCFSGEKQGRQCWRQSIARSETQI